MQEPGFRVWGSEYRNKPVRFRDLYAGCEDPSRVYDLGVGHSQRTQGQALGCRGAGCWVQEGLVLGVVGPGAGGPAAGCQRA